MTRTIRLGGAQIPVTTSIEKNELAIKKAIDWASENSVDYLVTPEASLSGYSTDFEKNFPILAESLTNIEKYAATKNVGLCLGTIWAERKSEENDEIVLVKKNQIRYYSKTGKLLGTTDKMVLTALDTAIGIESDTMLRGILLPVRDEIAIPTAGLVCADLYGWCKMKGGLPQQYHNIGVKLFIHATNAERNTDPLKNEVEKIWLESWLRRVSLYQECSIIVADNCYMMDGTEYDGPTMTQSGVVINGEWVTKVPRTGTQYFYYDFDLDTIAVDIPEEWKLTT
jgi:predicted amidohydrolase